MLNSIQNFGSSVKLQQMSAQKNVNLSNSINQSGLQSDTCSFSGSKAKAVRKAITAAEQAMGLQKRHIPKRLRKLIIMADPQVKFNPGGLTTVKEDLAQLFAEGTFTPPEQFRKLVERADLLGRDINKAINEGLSLREIFAKLDHDPKVSGLLRKSVNDINIAQYGGLSLPEILAKFDHDPKVLRLLRKPVKDINKATA